MDGQINGRESGISAENVQISMQMGMIEQLGESWWTEELVKMKASLRRKRIKWQATRAEEDRVVFIEQRNAYKKAVRQTKEKYVENQVQAMVDDGPWYRAWKC